MTVAERVALRLRAFAIRRHRDDPARWLAAARATMRATRYCVLVTHDAAGPTARTVQPFPPDRDLTVHLGTDPTSRKAAQIDANGEAVVIFQRNRDGACVVAHCRARLLDDPPSKQRYFMPVWRAFWPAGPDERFAVIRCEPHTLEIWDARRGVTPPPFGLRSARLTKADDGRWVAAAAG
ncbi:pyridoxamine 5'-phosphate oxidase family protein [Patulibacter defluvii]|uniref:pyridoxamine 5'-phosphate oxidase family protein n=1 Tax=Patulibacter defluvii TaxID=3095358 RepID=UPI002A74D839|nr:pyridoxamine 5'-phosphate oxidase family protein [Patulibacter sp. DM4]